MRSFRFSAYLERNPPLQLRRSVKAREARVVGTAYFCYKGDDALLESGKQDGGGRTRYVWHGPGVVSKLSGMHRSA